MCLERNISVRFADDHQVCSWTWTQGMALSYQPSGRWSTYWTTG